MEAQIIAVGSELLTPARLDTNSLFLTERLNRRGVDVVRKVVVGDDLRRISREIRIACENSTIIIVTGGLGPTLDDLSRDATAVALGREMILHPEIVEEIAARFARFGRTMAENNKRQAYVLEGAEILPNPNGTAPGQYLEHNGGVVMLLPGPPRELRPMFLEQCEPRLERIESPYKYYTSSMRIVGLGESDVDQRIGPIYSAEPRAQTTILAAPGDIQLHVRGRADTVDQAREIAEAIAEKVAAELGEHVYARSDRTLEEIVASLLRERSLRLAVAESCTGGMIAERLTAIAGSSDYFVGGWVSYSPAAKADWLGVQAATIEAHGVYSEQTAREMAERARAAAGGEGVGLSVTGIAGPAGGSDETPVGTVFLGVADSAGTVVKRRQFGGDRARNRQLASQSALDLLRRRLLGLLSE